MKKFGLNTQMTPVEIKILDEAWGVAVSFSVAADADKYPTKGMLFYPKSISVWGAAGKKPTVVDDPKDERLKSARSRWRHDVCTVIASFNGSSDPQAIEDAVLAEKPTSPAHFAKLAIDQLRGNWRANKVDVFLQWGKPSKKDGRKYLEVAGGSQDGSFITPSAGAKSWFEDRLNGLTYVLPSEQVQHPISRTAGFMRSQKAINVSLAEAAASHTATLPTAPPPTMPSNDDDLPF